ncbi:MAG: HIRAN domain-containing protein, partial [Oscillospiraceae bacterium]|nr:HIRAN domain-containing protein [Oscillospiraceae bacterium]
IIYMDDLEIQREATIEIVGTQYDGRAENHKNLYLHQKLVMKHQKNNTHDDNAILLFTEDNKELGFIPRGQASLYVPAIDSEKYNFTVEVAKTEPDSQRPILLVRIVAEYKHLSKQNVEKSMIDFVQNIVNGYSLLEKEYLKFICMESVEMDSLVSCLNKIRLIYQLYVLSSEFITENHIEPDTSEFKPFKKDALILYIKDMQLAIREVLKELQKIYNELIDIEDEEEYQRTQSEIREKRKRFRRLNDLCESYYETVENYVTVVSTETEEFFSTSKRETVNNPESEAIDLSEQAFFNWLLLNGGVSNNTAKGYISSIHNLEKLYQRLFGIKKSLLGAVSKTDAKEMIETLILRDEYINANARSGSLFIASLNKFVQFADISVDLRKRQIRTKNNPELIAPQKSDIKIVDFNHPEECISCKPTLFQFKGGTYATKSWRDLYVTFLRAIYCDSPKNSNTLTSKIGKSLYGRSIDFADSNSVKELRIPIKIFENFYAESNLSTIDIIKRIKSLMDLCSVDYRSVMIEYNTQKLAENSLPVEEVVENSSNAPDVSVKSTEPEVDKTFKPDFTRPFDLKEAIIAILSSDDTKINQSRGYKGGLTSIALRKLIKEFYGKTINLCTIATLCLTDESILSVGKGSYILNQAMLSKMGDESPEIKVPEQPHQSVIADELPKQNVQTATNSNLADKIIDLIRQNKDNLQYQDGFSSYEVKFLLTNEGIHPIPESEIDAILSASDQLKEIEDGYYIYDAVENHTIASGKLSEDSTFSVETRRIILRLNGNIIRTNGCSDALCKICEFAISYRPFIMARIAGQGICINGNEVFYRKVVPVAGCRKLSNEVQVMQIDSYSDLQVITSKIKEYCQIDDNLITLIS